MKRLFLCYVLLLLAGPALFWASSADGALRPWTGAFPQLDGSARGTALGGNMAALAAGSEAIYWNPAGLLSVDRKDLSFSYSDLFGLGLVSHSVAQFAWPHMGTRVEWEGSKIRRVPLPPPASRALGAGFSSLRGDLDNGRKYTESQFALAFAWRMGTRTQIGVAYRFLKAGSDTSYSVQGSSSANASGHAFDFGMQERLGPIRLGVAAMNLGSWMTFEPGKVLNVQNQEDSEPLAVRWSTALAWIPVNLPLTVTVQANWIGGALSISQTGSGVEWRPVDALVLRGALRQRWDDVGTRDEWSAGAGFHVRSWRFDYAWQDNARGLGGTQRWSAAVQF